MLHHFFKIVYCLWWQWWKTIVIRNLPEDDSNWIYITVYTLLVLTMHHFWSYVGIFKVVNFSGALIAVLLPFQNLWGQHGRLEGHHLHFQQSKCCAWYHCEVYEHDHEGTPWPQAIKWLKYPSMILSGRYAICLPRVIVLLLIPWNWLTIFIGLDLHKLRKSWGGKNGWHNLARTVASFFTSSLIVWERNYFTAALIPQYCCREGSTTYIYFSRHSIHYRIFEISLDWFHGQLKEF